MTYFKSLDARDYSAENMQEAWQIYNDLEKEKAQARAQCEETEGTTHKLNTKVKGLESVFVTTVDQTVGKRHPGGCWVGFDGDNYRPMTKSEISSAMWQVRPAARGVFRWFVGLFHWRKAPWHRVEDEFDLQIDAAKELVIEDPDHDFVHRTQDYCQKTTGRPDAHGCFDKDDDGFYEAGQGDRVIGDGEEDRDLCPGEAGPNQGCSDKSFKRMT